MKGIWQFIKFGLVGVSNTLISEGIYCILVFCGIHYLIAYFIGFVISVLNAYYWSNRFVFRREAGEVRVWWKVLAKTYVAYLGGFVLSSVLLIFWIDIVNISQYLGWLEELSRSWGYDKLDAYLWGEILAAGINLLITVPLNFVVNKFWAYKAEKRKESEALETNT